MSAIYELSRFFHGIQKINFGQMENIQNSKMWNEKKYISSYEKYAYLYQLTVQKS